MLTRTSQYALRAMIQLSSDNFGEQRSSRRIARCADIPERYSSMILGELARAGILKSTRGKGGGFRLARPPEQISLVDIVQRFEPAPNAPRACPFGNTVCGDDNPCVAHSEWKEVIETEQRFFERKTLHDVSTEKGTVSKHKKKRKER